jgi:hypothetical protein
MLVTAGTPNAPAIFVEATTRPDLVEVTVVIPPPRVAA